MIPAKKPDRVLAGPSGVILEAGKGYWGALSWSARMERGYSVRSSFSSGRKPDISADPLADIPGGDLGDAHLLTPKCDGNDTDDPNRPLVRPDGYFRFHLPSPPVGGSPPGLYHQHKLLPRRALHKDIANRISPAIPLCNSPIPGHFSHGMSVFAPGVSCSGSVRAGLSTEVVPLTIYISFICLTTCMVKGYVRRIGAAVKGYVRRIGGRVKGYVRGKLPRITATCG